MGSFISLLKDFILEAIFNRKEEYDITKSNFNALKVVIYVIVVLVFMFNIAMFVRMEKLYEKAKQICPEIVELNVSKSPKKKKQIEVDK